MVALVSSETSVLTRATQRNIPEDDYNLAWIFQCLSRNNFSFIFIHPVRCFYAPLPVDAYARCKTAAVMGWPGSVHQFTSLFDRDRRDAGVKGGRGCCTLIIELPDSKLPHNCTACPYLHNSICVQSMRHDHLHSVFGIEDLTDMKQAKKNVVALSPQANSTDWGPPLAGEFYCQILRVERFRVVSAAVPHGRQVS
jgi:hypothetical protein